MEYTPAPGQLINLDPWGTPGGARSLEGGILGSVCLGAFGGYVVFRFEEPVENDPLNPYGVDFTIFGNPMPEWSEPGVVWVMKDENENLEADDTWYELAGSDYWFSSTRRDFRVTYSNPGGEFAADVPWQDQSGSSGVIRANSLHTQPYYPVHDSFPAIDPESYSLEGTLLQGQVFEHFIGYKSMPRAFGYADNQFRGAEPFSLPDNPYTRELENSGGDAFDIGWAVDTNGDYVEIDRIHFIKVQNGILADGGRLGELSTELTGALDVPPDPSLTGESRMVVIRDLPPLLEVAEYQLEVFIFQDGRKISEGPVQWTTSNSGATVNKYHLLRVTEEGPLTITAALPGNPEIDASVSTTVQFGQTAAFGHSSLDPGPVLYPNPVSDYFRIKGCTDASLLLCDASGKVLIRVDHYQENNALDIRAYPGGIYLLRIARDSSVRWFKLIKE
ncbi:MAG: T9SS type A sorting domain-containing protein [Bacteroidales bacterium]|nr:T9SS type A sorting domain-containing protein [Bacteroidales bacterium]